MHIQKYFSQNPIPVQFHQVYLFSGDNGVEKILVEMEQTLKQLECVVPQQQQQQLEQGRQTGTDTIFTAPGSMQVCPFGIIMFFVPFFLYEFGWQDERTDGMKFSERLTVESVLRG